MVNNMNNQWKSKKQTNFSLGVVHFENGSKIQSISSEENKQGHIRGRMLTDEEYKQIMFIENTKAEETIDIVMKILGFK